MSNAGRPAKFNPEELKKQIEAYLADADEKGDYYTNEGLCLYLEIDPTTLHRYSQKPEFRKTIQTVKLAIYERLIQASLKKEISEKPAR